MYLTYDHAGTHAEGAVVVYVKLKLCQKWEDAQSVKKQGPRLTAAQQQRPQCVVGLNEKNRQGYNMWRMVSGVICSLKASVMRGKQSAKMKEPIKKQRQHQDERNVPLDGSTRAVPGRAIEIVEGARSDARALLLAMAMFLLNTKEEGERERESCTIGRKCIGTLACEVVLTDVEVSSCVKVRVCVFQIVSHRWTV